MTQTLGNQKSVSRRASVVAGLVTAGAALRLTRFFTSDTLGEWLVVAPAKRWSHSCEIGRRDARMRTITFMYEEHGETMTPEAGLALEELSQTLAEDDPISWQARLTSGLDCPFCVGFWVTLAAIPTTMWAYGPRPTTRPALWAQRGLRVGLGALALNYVTGHIAARLDS